ncbi:MAG TPA: sensor histidine kinase [Marmoricola sp.]|nr:sensor histidine kinase [Marmoricola sp.]
MKHPPAARSATTPAWLAACLAIALVAAAVLVDAGGQPWKLVLLPAFWVVPGALIASGRSRNPLGWLMLAVGILFAVAAFGTRWAESGHATGAAWAVWAADRGSAALVPCVLAVLLLLPDGHLPSPRWRPAAFAALSVQVLLVIAWSSVAGPAAAPESTWPVDPPNPVGVLPASWGPVLEGLDAWLLQVPLLLGVAAVVVRFRRPAERSRLAGVLAAAVVFGLLVVAGRALWPSAADVFDVVGSALLAAALTAAVLRKRLHEVDVVIHHAFVYSVLTALIAGGYVAVVALLGSRGSDLPPLGVGVVTAVLALLLMPLRKRLQRLLDLAMYGDTRRPHVAVRRLADTVSAATTLDAVVSGLARTTAASLRAPWVEVVVEGHRGTHGTLTEGPLARLPLVSGDLQVGTLEVGFGLGRRPGTGESALLVELADHGGRAVHAVLLSDALLANRQLLVTAREEERSRLRRDLHDELGPTLAGLAMQLNGLQALLRDEPELASQRLARLETVARQALDDVRRVSRELRPPALDELGLVGALEQAAREAGLSLAVSSTSTEPFAAAVEVAAYRIGAEALLNVARHAGTGEARLSLERVDDHVVLSVGDDGCGSDEFRSGVGTQAMRERAEELGGTLSISRTAVNGGTVVEARLPLGRTSEVAS